jgi:hypothetical protein
VKGTVQSLSTGYWIPGFWKNGAWNTLSMTLPNGRTAVNGNPGGWGIDTNGDAYFGGSLLDPVSGYQVPVYWKNGAIHEVSLASLAGAIYGGTVVSIVLPPYAAAFTLLLAINDNLFNGYPAYMVGGSITKVTTGSQSNGTVWWANLSPSGDVYATGMIGRWNDLQPPVYWLNWSLRTLPTPSGKPYGGSGGAQFSGGHVYIDGNPQNASGFQSCVFWIDEVLSVLDDGGYFGAGGGAYIFE